jgi:uncharacterized membrane protein YccC
MGTQLSSLLVVDRTALRRAARAAIVITGVFAFADKVIGNPTTALFAAFGSFALLVLAQFSGPPRVRSLAYLALGCVGAVFITLGTLCSRSPWLAAAAMAVVGFGTLFSGVLGGYFAAGVPAALLSFVLPATVPAANSAIPDRLAGWGLATGAAICAVMLLWPPRHGDDLQPEAADAVRSVADVVDADAGEQAERGRVARNAVEGLERRLRGTQQRPTGPTGPLAALASLPGELDWLLSLLLPATEWQPPEPAAAEGKEAMAAAAGVLRAAAEALEGRRARPDFARLDAARDAVAGALVHGLPDLVSDASTSSVPLALEAPFRIRAATYSARQVAGYALRAAGADVPDLDGPETETEPEPQPARAVLRATEQRAREHGTVASVWFQNSLRGAAGFAIGVYIAQRTGVQHGFWVVLGTLSVLRSNALGTGRSILSAVAGTAVGIVLGAVLVIAIGTHEGVLWVVLPVAVFLAAYAPRAISFAVGQAGFTVFVLVLFNLLAPVGWKVGLVRAEDVAIGFAISLAVGVLFWPRGAAALIRQDLAIAYERAADYLAAAARQLIDGRTSKDAATARAAADVAVRRLDEAFRQYLGERSATPVNPEDIAALVSGASRVRRAAESLTALARMSNGENRLDGCGRNLDRELGSLQTWYSAFGFALMSGGAVPPPHVPDEEDARQLLSCVRDAAQTRGPATANAALALLLASQHLDNLSSLEALLSERANAIRTAPQDGGALRKLRVLAS